jgi:hypothetical protein
MSSATARRVSRKDFGARRAAATRSHDVVDTQNAREDRDE